MQTGIVSGIRSTLSLLAWYEYTGVTVNEVREQRSLEAHRLLRLAGHRVLKRIRGPVSTRGRETAKNETNEPGSHWSCRSWCRSPSDRTTSRSEQSICVRNTSTRKRRGEDAYLRLHGGAHGVHRALDGVAQLLGHRLLGVGLVDDVRQRTRRCRRYDAAHLHGRASLVGHGLSAGVVHGERGWMKEAVVVVVVVVERRKGGWGSSTSQAGSYTPTTLSTLHACLHDRSGDRRHGAMYLLRRSSRQRPLPEKERALPFLAHVGSSTSALRA